MLSAQAVAADHGGRALGLVRLPRALAEDAQLLGDTCQRAAGYLALLRIFEIGTAGANSRQNYRSNRDYRTAFHTHQRILTFHEGKRRLLSNS
jgi:hypothetical protein